MICWHSLFGQLIRNLYLRASRERKLCGYKWMQTLRNFARWSRWLCGPFPMRGFYLPKRLSRQLNWSTCSVNWQPKNLRRPKVNFARGHSWLMRSANGNRSRSFCLFFGSDFLDRLISLTFDFDGCHELYRNADWFSMHAGISPDFPRYIPLLTRMCKEPQSAFNSVLQILKGFLFIFAFLH